MANIKPYTDKIANAIYGEEVRGSIINALNAVNTSGGSGGTGGGGDGVGISAITQLYARSTSYTTAPADSSFSTSQTALTSTYPYQWAKITYTFTDETEQSIKYVCAVRGSNGSTGSTGPAGNDGADGKGIASIAVTWAHSSSYSSTPTDGSFSTTHPSISATYPYIWERTVTTFTDNTQQTVKRVVAARGSNGTTPTVVNNVTSTSTTSALSAYQGKLLADRVNTLENTGGSSSKGFIINVYSGDHTDLSTGAKTLEALRNGIVPLIYTGTTYAPAISSKVEYVCGAYQMTLHYYDMTCGYPNLAEIQLNTDLMCE